MKNFETWFKNFKLPQSKILPEPEHRFHEALYKLAWEKDNVWYMPCCVCGREDEIEPEWVDDMNYRHYGGCGPSCCP